MTADAEIRALIADCGRQCEIVMALERFGAKVGDLELAAQAADLADKCSRRAFDAARGVLS